MGPLSSFPCVEKGLTIKATATRVSKASRDSVWKAMEDVESYPKWADSTRKTRFVSCKIVSREGNSAVCDADETPQGTRIDMGFDVEPNSVGLKLYGLFANEKKMLEGIADEYCKQLSDYAEAHPS